MFTDGDPSAIAGRDVAHPDAARAPSAYGVVVVGNEAPPIADHAANTAIGTIAASTKRVARCGDRATAISYQPRAHPQ